MWTWKDDVLLVVGAVGVFLLGIVLFMMPVKAHDWYPMECCHSTDCAPVDKAELLPTLALLLTSKHGTAIVPREFPTRASMDSRMHVCMRPGDNGTMRTVCLFLPPGM